MTTNQRIRKMSALKRRQHNLEIYVSIIENEDNNKATRQKAREKAKIAEKDIQNLEKKGIK